MTIKFFSIIFLVFSVVTAEAQNDSISTRSVNGLQDQYLYELYKQQAAGMIFNPIQHFAIAGIAYQHEKGDYRRVQEAAKSAGAGFFSEGLKKVDNFWVQGKFSYKRQWDDSVHNSFKRDFKSRSPYYLWTPRTGDMNHEVYHLDGQFVALVGKKLLLGAGASYDASDDYRTIDPRPFINYFNFDVKASIGYKINQHNLLVIEPNAGYSKEGTSAYSKNNDSISAPAYQVYRAEGLGEVSSASESKRQLNQWTNFTGIGIGYYFNNKQLGNWLFKYTYLDTRERNFNRFYNPTTELEYSKVGYYDHQLQLAWNKKYNKLIANITWVGKISKAKDFNAYLGGVNYTAWENSNIVKAGISLYKGNRAIHEFQAHYARVATEQKDGNNSVAANYKNSTYQLQYRWNIYQKVSLIQLTLDGGIRENGNSSLSIPTAAFDYLFVPAILYPDAMYATTNNWQTGIKVAYNSLKKSQRLRWGIELGTQYTKNSKAGLYYAQSGFMPGKDRLYWNTALHFFL